VSLHTIRCGDYADFGDPDEEWTVEGFPSAEAAAEYARRFIRAQIEDLRAASGSAEELKDMYFRFGEYAFAAGLDHAAWAAHCIATPAARKADTDYAAAEPRRRGGAGA
jgi:hypothetical protein